MRRLSSAVRRPSRTALGRASGPSGSTASATALRPGGPPAARGQRPARWRPHGPRRHHRSRAPRHRNQRPRPDRRPRGHRRPARHPRPSEERGAKARSPLQARQRSALARPREPFLHAASAPARRPKPNADGTPLAPPPAVGGGTRAGSSTHEGQNSGLAEVLPRVKNGGGGGSRTHVRSCSVSASTRVSPCERPAPGREPPLDDGWRRFLKGVFRPLPSRHGAARDYPGLDTPEPFPPGGERPDGSSGPC